MYLGDTVVILAETVITGLFYKHEIIKSQTLKLHLMSVYSGIPVCGTYLMESADKSATATRVHRHIKEPQTISASIFSGCKYNGSAGCHFDLYFCI